jgi:Signal transduction histidine kinase
MNCWSAKSRCTRRHGVRPRKPTAPKNEFLGSLSHELRTPLSGVSGSVHLLRDTALDDRQREYLRMIEYANGTLLETLEDMLGFSRLEAGKLEVTRESFALRDVIDDMLALQSVAARSKGLALVRDIADDVPERLVGDRRKLNQILLNTIGNAIKFTDEGDVTVKVGRAADDPPGALRLRFQVLDTGIGIPTDQQEAVSSRSSRWRHGAPSARRDRPGAGHLSAPGGTDGRAPVAQEHGGGRHGGWF